MEHWFASPLKIGMLAPSLKFSGLDDQPVSLTDFIGHETLLLFWNPSCGFCQQKLDDLKSWEMNQPSNVPRLLLISTGTAAENRAMNLRSLVVLDHNFQAGAAFGAGGTPWACFLTAPERLLRCRCRSESRACLGGHPIAWGNAADARYLT
jgi:thiol-disulfide isomerase/thioredoxin